MSPTVCGPERASLASSIAILWNIAPPHDAHVRRAIGKTAVILCAADFDPISDALRDHPERIAALIFGSTHDGSAVVADYVVGIARAHRAIPILAYCDVSNAVSPEIRQLVRAGVHQLLMPFDDAAAIRSALRAANRECAINVAHDHLAPIVPAALHPFVDASLRHHDTVMTPASIANLLATTQKKLAELCVIEHLPPPAELLAWCRIMIAAHLLSRPGATPSSTAAALSLPSSAALCRQITAIPRLDLAGLRSPAGLALVANCLRDRLITLGRPVPKAGVTLEQVRAFVRNHRRTD